MLDYSQFEGKQFWYLTFKKALQAEGKRRYIEVGCKCGTEFLVEWQNLKSGKQVSCGCKKSEHKVGRTHGLYDIWRGIKNRCYNPNYKAYKYYGGRGVKMCKQWLENYETFYEWGLGNGWSEGLEIDKDIKGDGLLYSPETCCFVTHKDNMSVVKRKKKISKQMADVILNSKESGRSLSKSLGITRYLIAKVRNENYWEQ